MTALTPKPVVPCLRITDMNTAIICGRTEEPENRRMTGKVIRVGIKSGRAALIPVLVAALVTACGGGSSTPAPQVPPPPPPPPPNMTVALTALNVTGIKTPLNPDFSADVLRYSVIATDSMASEISVTATAPNEVTISVNGEPLASDATLVVSDLSSGDVINIRAQGTGSQASESVEYEVLYLPSDFPEITVTVLQPGASADPIYVNMLGPGNQYLVILDNNGVPTFFRGEANRSMDFKWHSTTGERSYALATGTTNQWGRANNEVVILDASNNQIDEIETVGLSHTGFHDFLINDNDELILVSYDGSIRDLTAQGLSDQEIVEDSVVQVLDRATRQVLFEWNSWGHIPYEHQTTPSPHREYAHINSVFEDFDGNLIMSFRHVSQVVKVARPSGQIMWRLGGRTNQFQFVNDPFSNICGQHTVSRLDSGNILLFDNGQNCWPIVAERGETTRVAEFQLDEQNMTAELVWSYSDPNIINLFAGSAQRLPNGNTMIGWGAGSDVLATEVTSDGTKVFEITAVHDGFSPVLAYRVRRFSQ
jgi:hypothetical protein